MTSPLSWPLLFRKCSYSGRSCCIISTLICNSDIHVLVSYPTPAVGAKISRNIYLGCNRTRKYLLFMYQEVRVKNLTDGKIITTKHPVTWMIMTLWTTHIFIMMMFLEIFITSCILTCHRPKMCGAKEWVVSFSFRVIGLVLTDSRFCVEYLFSWSLNLMCFHEMLHTYRLQSEGYTEHKNCNCF